MSTDVPFREPAADPTGRPKLRPPVGLPERGRRRGWRGTAASVAVHALILILLIVPFFASDTLKDAVLGAGGAGPAGGGGGGRGGTGGQAITERLQFVQVAPAPQPKATVTPPVVPPVKPPVVPPITPPPKPVEAPKPAPTPAPAAPVAPAASVTSGTGGGSGNDGSQGNGPGTGGGVGSGEGTGRGTANGPGTGGGPGSIYPPQPTMVLIPPQPVPGKVKGFELVAHFDVDEKGTVLAVEFTETRDGGYNRKLRDMLREIRFRPAVRADGAPVRATAEIRYTL